MYLPALDSDASRGRVDRIVDKYGTCFGMQRDADDDRRADKRRNENRLIIDVFDG